MRKSQPPYSLQIEINVEKSTLTESYCKCKAGLDGHCSHIVGLLKTLQGLKLHNFKNAPDHQSCTSLPQQWHVPRGTKIKPVPLNHVVVARPKEKRKRKPVICHFDENYKLPRVDNDDIEKLLNIKGTPLEYMISKEAPKSQSHFGEVQTGSILSYQTRNLKHHEPVDSVGCGDTTLHHKSPISLPPEFVNLNKIMTKEELKKIEIDTRKQNNSCEWYQHRKGRLTASNFGKVMHRKARPSDSFLRDVFNRSSKSSPAMDYGRKHEQDGKAKYLETFPSRHLHECGLVINNEFNFLAASPDGVVCDNGNSGLIEVKSPYSVRNRHINEACDLPGFYLRKNGNNISLKKNHNYYAQIQGQLMITGFTFCDLVVYTQKSIFVERIQPDIDFMKTMLSKLSNFMKDYGS
ncbi:uncharacterized protein LOC134255349 [Saccostrea cucullata]|uniref:uncharacterized protein LOC134246719 n=1 Tax=Saccostrea cuccullata TaxID=36930 RepID=UPI002ED4EC83